MEIYMRRFSSYGPTANSLNDDAPRRKDPRLYEIVNRFNLYLYIYLFKFLETIGGKGNPEFTNNRI